MGDSFAVKINISRQIEEPTIDEEEMVIKIQHLYEEKASILKWEKNQFGGPEEEEEGEGESEEGEGEGESNGEEESE